MKMTFSFLVMVVLLVIAKVNSTDTAVTVPPLPINVTLATQSFTSECVAESADDLFFLVNGTEVNEGLDGFSESLTTSDGNTKTRTLTITVSLNISNTNIVCRAYSLNPLTEDISEPALILVQGSLDSPMVTNTSIIDNTGIYISWTPPPTLDGTVINGYYVSSTTGDSVYTEDDNVTLSITNPDPCGINISIIAYNGINGTAAEVDNIIFPSNELSKRIPVSTMVPDNVDELEMESTISVLLLVNISQLCPGEYPTDVLVEITNPSHSSVVHNHRLKLFNFYEEGIRVANVTIELSNWIFNVSFINSAGVFNITSIFPLTLNLDREKLFENGTLAAVTPTPEIIYIVVILIVLVLDLVWCECKTSRTARISLSPEKEDIHMADIYFQEPKQVKHEEEGSSELVSGTLNMHYVREYAASEPATCDSKKKFEKRECQSAPTDYYHFDDIQCSTTSDGQSHFGLTIA